MKRLLLAVVLIAAAIIDGYSQPVGKQPQTLVVHHATIVAFFPPVTRAELDSDEDNNEALSDFQFYTGKARAPLQQAGIDLREVDARSFSIRVGKEIRIFRTGKIGIGYYFIAPGRKPHVEYNVMADEDILEAAHKYFRIAIPREKCSGPHCSK
jgi:hypothetical protein